MTGFGRGQTNDCGYSVNCEIKGVNHRYFDPFIRISRRYSLLEDRIKEELRKHISRGRLEININIEKTEESRRNIKVDKDLAIAYYNYLKELAEKLNIPLDEIEVIFVNGFVEDLNYLIKVGDRVAFLPPGCPGPYRIALGFYGKNQDNPANFKRKVKE